MRNKKVAPREVIESSENQKYLEGVLAQEIKDYKAVRTVSLERAYQVFSHLTNDRRDAFLDKKGDDFFALLLKSNEQYAVDEILAGDREEERRRMTFVIEEVISTGLRNAINDGDVSSANYYMNLFPSDETTQVIQEVIREDDFRCIKQAAKDDHKPLLKFLLSQEESQSEIQKQFGNIGTHATKPVQKTQMHKNPIASCFVSMKHQVEDFFTKKSSKIIPDNIQDNTHKQPSNSNHSVDSTESESDSNYTP